MFRLIIIPTLFIFTQFAISNPNHHILKEKQKLHRIKKSKYHTKHHKKNRYNKKNKISINPISPTTRRVPHHYSNIPPHQREHNRVPDRVVYGYYYQEEYYPAREDRYYNHPPRAHSFSNSNNLPRHHYRDHTEHRRRDCQRNSRRAPKRDRARVIYYRFKK